VLDNFRSLVGVAIAVVVLLPILGARDYLVQYVLSRTSSDEGHICGNLALPLRYHREKQRATCRARSATRAAPAGARALFADLIGRS
jgi:hypothetical protein